MTLERRYIVVVGAMMTQFTVIGLLFAYALFFKAFEDEFGWSRTLLSAVTSSAFLIMGVVAMFGGRLNDIYGPRILLTFAGISAGTGFALLSQATEPWHLFLVFGGLVGMGMAAHDVVTLSTVARWFDKRRGLMTGVVKSGTAAGQVCIPPLAALLIAAFGWQSAAIVMGAAGAVVLVFAASLMSLPPKPMAQSDTSAAGLSLAQARGTRIFWSMCALQFLFFPTLTTVPLHIVVYGIDLGLTPAEAALLLSVTGAASVAGRLVVGGFSDRIGGRMGYVLCFVPLILALAALLMIQTAWLLFVVMAVYGFGHGGCFTVVSPTVAEFFGTRAHGAIFGPILFFGTIGGASGPILAGWIFDVTGSYSMAFAALFAMLVAALALALTLPRLGRGPLGGSSAALA